MDAVVTKVPTEKEIREAEQRLASMRQARESAKRSVLAAMASDDILSTFQKNELLVLMKRIQSRLTGPHRKVRGSTVPSDLKASLIQAIKSGDHTLQQMADMFNLSISYISRVKSDLKKAGGKSKSDPVMNAYSVGEEDQKPAAVEG